MTKTGVGLLFIAGGLVYGSLAIDKVNELTLGNLRKYNFLQPPTPAQEKQIKEIEKSPAGRKGIMLTYAAVLIAIGIYLLITNA